MYYTECKPKNKKWGRPGNKASCLYDYAILYHYLLVTNLPLAPLIVLCHVLFVISSTHHVCLPVEDLSDLCKTVAACHCFTCYSKGASSWIGLKAPCFREVLSNWSGTTPTAFLIPTAWQTYTQAFLFWMAFWTCRTVGWHTWYKLYVLAVIYASNVVSWKSTLPPTFDSNFCIGSKFTEMSAHLGVSFMWPMKHTRWVWESTAPSAMHIWGKKLRVILITRLPCIDERG